ncbi:MAG: B12-binding domain-containing radical SAM protein [Polyangiaceae bacterium]|nr:B12-binding domain-containing radical SAM protein [Polyangiaceae bacterium]
MKVAFVYPPFYAKPFNENLPTVDDEFGLFPHIGFGWAARGASAAGWEVRLWDAPAEKKSLDQVTRELCAWSPDLIAFSAHACQTIRDLYVWSRPIRQRTGVPTLVGGYEAKVYPHEIVDQGGFDFLCGGQGHQFLPEFLPALARGHGYERVADLFFRRHGELAHTRAGARPRFAEFPTPDRSIFDNRRYYSHVSQRKSFTIGMSEIGCPYPCTFCCMRQSGFDARTAEQVVDEMAECTALGIREIDWFDPLMLHDRQRALDIAREVRRRKLDVIWSCRSRVDSLSFRGTRRQPDHELIGALAEGGCRRIYFGIESGDDDVLREMMKGQVASSDLGRTLGAVREAGILALGFFMLGAPGDTRESVRRTVDLSLALPLSYAQYQIAVIKPHTELERRHVVGELGIDYWREYVAGRVDALLLPTPWTTLERAELERMARRAYLRFYSRPGYALSMLRRVQSRDELTRYARVALQLALRPLRPARAAGLGRRLGRAALAFAEATLTVASPGARHGVFAVGGGLRGALRLARDELARRTAEPVLGQAPDGVRSSVADPPPGRYRTFFDRLPEPRVGVDRGLGDE